MFLKNFSKLVSTTVLIQIVSFLLYPIITRTWNPTDFGKFSLLISVGNIICIFSTGQFQVGGMVESDEPKAKSLFNAAKFFNACTALLVFFTVMILQNDVRWLFLPLFVFSYSNYEIMRFEALRDKALNRFASGQIISRIGATLLKLIPGPAFFLVLTEVLGNLFAVLFFGRGNLKKIFSFTLPDFGVLKNYKKYPLFYTLNLGTQSLTYELPSILLGLQGQNYLIGIYGICQRILIQPLTIIANNVFTTIFSMPLSPDERTKKCVRIGVFAVSMGVILKIGFDFVGIKLLTVFLGGKWVEGKEFYTIFSYILITKVLGNMALANYVSTYRLERSTAIRLTQLCTIVLSYIVCGDDNIFFFKVFVAIDMLFDAGSFLISLRRT